MKIKIFLTFILIVIIGCSKTDENELFNQIESAYKNKEYSKVLELVKDYEDLDVNSELFLKVLKMKQNILLNNLNNGKQKENYLEAVNTCLLVDEKYSNTKDGKYALFLIGFIYSENLKDFEKSKEYYKKFIDKYPNDELVPQAKLEIENMGKSYDNLIK